MNRIDDETSRALLAAAHELLAHAGADALTVRRIASEAGMSTMNVYSRFGGKDGVIDELYADGYRRLDAALAALPVTDDAGEDLVRMALEYRAFALENAPYYRIMLRTTVTGFDPSPESTELALHTLGRVVERIEAGQRQGVIAEGDAVNTAAWLWATCHGMVSLELDRVGEERVVWADVFEHGIRISLSGLRRRADVGHS